jgi:adenosylcobinamide-GDP ribazoletransferase
MRHELRLFFVALQFLTRVPAPAWVGYDAAWLNRSVRHFPVVGALVGAAGAAVALVAVRVWPPSVAAALSIAFAAWLTAASTRMAWPTPSTPCSAPRRGPRRSRS